MILPPTKWNIDPEKTAATANSHALFERLTRFIVVFSLRPEPKCIEVKQKVRGLNY